MASDPKKPYGSVEYADPGYHEDGVHRYPIDTADHARAAWSYINQPDNASGYTPEQLSQIKDRIKAACKKFGIHISEGNDSEDRSESDSSVETRSANVKLEGVDFGQRIITVLAVPYEQPTQVPFRQEMWTEVFSRSAFKGIEGQNRKIPVTAALEIPAPDHRGGRIVGKVISSDPYRDEGLVSEVKISRTDQGDETLALAGDDALAVSVGFMVKNPRFDQDLDRYRKTRRVNRAFLDHLAFVGQPAYPGAKVLAMRGEGSTSELDLPMASPTPRMDEYLNDPILQWASDHVRR